MSVPGFPPQRSASPDRRCAPRVPVFDRRLVRRAGRADQDRGPVSSKLLVSQGYRAPVIENINASSGELQPERTTVFEAETGHQLGDHMFAAVRAEALANPSCQT